MPARAGRVHRFDGLTQTVAEDEQTQQILSAAQVPELTEIKGNVDP